MDKNDVFKNDLQAEIMLFYCCKFSFNYPDFASTREIVL